MPMPPEKEDKEATWPEWPRILRTSTSHEEGCERMWQTSTKEILLDDKGNVRAVRCVKIEWAKDPATGRFTPKEVPDSAFEIPAQRVFLAMGFTQPSQGLLDAFTLAKDARGAAGKRDEPLCHVGRESLCLRRYPQRTVACGESPARRSALC